MKIKKLGPLARLGNLASGGVHKLEVYGTNRAGRPRPYGARLTMHNLTGYGTNT